MCGRYYIEDSPELRPVVEAMNRSPLVQRFQQKSAVLSRGEIRPTNVAPVIASNRAGQRAVFPMRWGFAEKTLIINARTETASVRPLFREAWSAHRCVVPATYYVEWEHLTANDGRTKTGDRYLLQPKGSAVTWLCGLYRLEEGLPCFVILTREPGEEIRFLHDRMPLILPEEHLNAWISPQSRPEELMAAARTDMIFERIG